MPRDCAPEAVEERAWSSYQVPDLPTERRERRADAHESRRLWRRRNKDVLTEERWQFGLGRRRLHRRGRRRRGGRRRRMGSSVGCAGHATQKHRNAHREDGHESARLRWRFADLRWTRVVLKCVGHAVQVGQGDAPLPVDSEIERGEIRVPARDTRGRRRPAAAILPAERRLGRRAQAGSRHCPIQDRSADQTSERAPCPSSAVPPQPVNRAGMGSV